jgi:hypothetical protein
MNFSFILPAWKGRYLHEAIASILNQTFVEFELIVVDDASPEPIKAITESFGDERVIYYRNPYNIGGKDLVAQWNSSLEYAKGDYVILATDDDLYEPNFLSSFLPLIEKYPHADIMRARILQINAEGEIIGIDSCYKEYLLYDEFVYHQLHGMRGGIPQYIFKRKALVDRGGFVNFPKAWASDDATAIMMAEHGVINSQEHLVRFRWSDLNISSNKSLGYEKLKARLQYNQWLESHLRPIPRSDDWHKFLATHIDDYISVYKKITLVSTLKAIRFAKRIPCLNQVVLAEDLSVKDKISIIYHSLF